MLKRKMNDNEVKMLQKFTTEDLSFESLVREVREDYDKRMHPKRELRYLQ